MFKRNAITKIEEVVDSEVKYSHQVNALANNNVVNYLQLKNCAANRLDIHLDNTPTSVSATLTGKSGSTDLTVMQQANKISISLPEGVYWTGNDQIELKTTVNSREKVYLFGVQVTLSNPAAFTYYEHSSCENILFTITPHGGGAITSYYFLTPAVHAGGSDYLSDKKEIRFAPLNGYCKYNDVSHTLYGDRVIQSPEVTLSAATYCQHDDGVQIQMDNTYEASVLLFAEINGTPQSVRNEQYLTVGVGEQSVRFYAQASNGTGCKAYAETTYTVTEYPAPAVPMLSGSLYDCGNGTTLTHNNPEYDTQYWLYDGNDNLIKHKGANFWLFRRDQYDSVGGQVHPEAHRVMELIAGTYKIVATHDEKTCTGTFPFTIADHEAQIDLQPRQDDLITICQSENLYNLFELFEAGELRDNIENRVGGLRYTFSVSVVNNYSTIPVVQSKYINTSSLEANREYDVALTIVTANGCSKIIEHQFMVIPRPGNFTLTASTTGHNVCDGLAWDLSVQNPETSLTYTWYINNTATTVTGIAFAPANLADGTHTAYAVAVSVNGCRTPSDVKTATARSFSNQVQLTAGTAEYCQSADVIELFDYLEGSDADKAAVRSQNNITYAFNFSLGGPSVQHGHTLNLANAPLGESTLKLTLQQNGCVREFTKPVTIKETPLPFTITANGAAGSGSVTVCNEPTVVLAAGTPVSSVEWYADGALLATAGAATTHDHSITGTIQYSATANLNGCTSESSNTVSVTRNFVDFGDLVLDGTQTAYCQSSTRIDLFNFVSGAEKDNVKNMYNGWSYEFTPSGTGLKIDGHELVLSQSTPSGIVPYTLTLTIAKDGCTKDFTKNISIKGRPNIPVLTASAGGLCNGQTSTITASGNATVFEWYKNGESMGASGATVVHTEDGAQLSTQYTAVALADGSGAACRSDVSEAITITSNAPIGTFAMSKTCYSTTERPVITTANLSNIGNIAVTATINGNARNIGLNSDYTFTTALSPQNTTWNISATVTSTNGCSRVVDLGSIRISNACPTSSPLNMAPYSLTAACPECPDCEEVRQINGELEYIYNNYLQQWKSRGRYKALLSPTVTANGEQLTVNIYATGTPGTAQLHLVDIGGAVLGSKAEYIYEGENKVDISNIYRPTGQLYMVRIVYPDGSYEILKGLTK